jgi:translation initiation factor 2B subunit (eIF-2B alpha/beta/delta family)
METWERVEIDMDIGRYGPHAEHALQRIPNDREHGAAELAGWALDALLQEVEEQCAATRGGGGGEGGNKDQQQEKEQAMLLMSHLKNYSYLLAHSRPSMAAPLSAVTAVLNSVQKSSKESKEKAILFTSVDLLNSFSEAVQQEKQKMHDASQQVKQHTIAMLDRNRVTSMLTLSLSSTVRDVIEQYGKLFVDDTSQQKGVFVSSSSSSSSSSSQLKVIVCESRPLFEGVRLADYWKKTNTGIDCTIIIDAAAAKYIDKVDIVLVGADSIRIKRRRKGSEDTMMEVVNKVGTHMVALAAQEAGVDVYVVSDSWKVVGSSSWEGGGIEEEEEGTEEMGAEEVTAAWGDVLGTSSGCSSNVKVENYYFEATPMRLIKGVVTEQGELDARELVVMAEKKGREVEGAFSDDVGVGVGEIR